MKIYQRASPYDRKNHYAVVSTRAFAWKGKIYLYEDRRFDDCSVVTALLGVGLVEDGRWFSLGV
jgi:hypothetical protein